jgi:hypothetical protein
MRHLRRGDLAPAAKMLELAADRSRAAGLPIVFPVAASMLGSRTSASRPSWRSRRVAR